MNLTADEQANWDKIVQAHPELAEDDVKEKKKVNLVMGTGRNTNVKYGDGYTSLAGNDWKKVLAFGALEGLLAILAIVALSLGVGICLIGILSLKGWHVLGGAALICVGIISGLVVYHLHGRI